MTIEDLELAIKILKRFIRIWYDSQVVMRQLGAMSREHYQRPEDRFLDMFMRQQQQQLGVNPPANPPEEELTSEEKERLKKLKEKYEKKDEKETK